MQMTLYASLALSAAILIAAAVLIARNQPSDKGLACLCETWMTAVLGGMLVLIGIAACIMKLIDPAVAGEEQDSYLAVAGINVVCQGLGAFCLLFTFVKKVIAFDDHVLTISTFGKRREVLWKDIVKAEKPVLSRAVKLTDKSGNTVTVNGDAKAYAQFVDIAKQKIRPRQGKELLDQVESRLRLGR